MTTCLLFSGGLDSTVLLARLLDDGERVHALGIDYGQQHVRELDHARTIAAELGVPFDVLPLPGLGALLPSALTTGEGSKVVPGRNAVLVTAAVAFAMARGLDAVALGVTAADAADFPDCRPGFLAVLAEVARAQGVQLLAPLVHASKADVLRLGVKLGAPVDWSWSCYTGQPTPCGTCDACRDRAEAFGAVPG